MKIFYSLILLLLLNSCSTGKRSQNNSHLNKSEIEIAINHFTKTALFKKDSVFPISLQISKSLNRRIVTIIPWSEKKILVTKNVYVGSRGYAPSRFIISNNKLFYWRDSTAALTQEALDVFRRFHLLQDDQNGTVVISDGGSDDWVKVAHYYFCMDTRIRKFKHIVSRRAAIYLIPPKMRCKS